jgi:hypothetical protein
VSRRRCSCLRLAANGAQRADAGRDQRCASHRTAAAAVPAPVTLDRDLPALAGRIAELYGAAGDALVAAGTDCTRASAGLTALRDRFADVRDAIARVVADNRVALLEPELDAQRDVIKAALARMKPTLDACKTDAKLDEALEGLAPGG